MEKYKSNAVGAGLGRPFRLLLLALFAEGAGGLAYARGGFAAWFMVWLLGGALTLSLAALLFQLMAVRVSRQLSSDVYACGETLRVELQIRHTSLLPLLWLSVSDRWVRETDGEQFSVTRLMFPGFKRRFTVRYSVEGLPRGVYRFAGTELVTGDCWGMAVRRRLCLSDRMFTVLPYARPLLPSAVPQGEGPEEAARLFHHGPSVTGHTVRDYVRGDPVQRIHWRSTARKGCLMTRVSEPGEAARVMVCLDTRTGSYSGESGDKLFELGIEWAAGLLHYASEQRLEAGLIYGGGTELRFQQAGKPDIAGAQRVLAELEHNGVVPLGELVHGAGERLLPAGAAVAVLTPCLGEPELQALLALRSRRRRVLLLYLQAHTVPSTAEREALQQLERAGCTVMTLKESGQEREVRFHAEYAGA